MREEWGVGLSLKKSQCLGGGGAEADISTLIQLEKCFAETSSGLRTPGRKRLTLSVAREGGELAESHRVWAQDKVTERNQMQADLCMSTGSVHPPASLFFTEPLSSG